MQKKLYWVLLVGFLIRLIALNQSLWLDEAITAKVVSQYNLFDISRFFSPLDFHPPFYYVFMKLWTGIFGLSEISLRMPSVIFSVLTAYILYLIGTKLKNHSFGLWTALFFLFNPLIIYYSQEARMYSLVTLLLTCATYVYIKLINELTNSRIIKRGKSTLPVFIFFLVLSIWTFYGSIYYIAGLLFILILKKQYRTVGIVGAVLLLSTSPLFSLISQQMNNARTSLLSVPHWDLVLGKATIKNLALIPIKFAIGRISFYPKYVYYLAAGVWTGIVFFIAAWGVKKSKGITLLFIVPFILTLLVSIFIPMMQYFRFIYTIPVLAILLAYGTHELHEEKQLRLVIFSGFLFFSLIYLLYPQFHREDWKALSKALPADQSVYMILPSSDPLKYYAPYASFRELRSIGQEYVYEKSLYIIPYTSEIYGFDYKSTLYKSGCFIKKTYIFREVQMEKWDCGKIG